MQNYRKSDYAINKSSPNIVYRFHNEIIEITLEDYLKENPDKTEHDFAELKALSDQIYYEQDRAESAQTRKDVSIHGLEETEHCATRALDEEWEERVVDMRKAIRRGDLFYADLNPVIGSEQGGIRPVLVIQNDVGNHFSPTVVAAAITSRKAKNSLPTHILLENVPGLAPTSLLLLEQLRTIDRKRLRGYIGRISKEKMLEVDAALAISIGIGYPKRKEDSQCMKMTAAYSLPEMPTD